MYYFNKPSVPEISKSLDITKSLAIDFSFHEYGSQRIRDNVAKSEGVFTNVVTWFRDRYGYGVDVNANTEYIKCETLTANQVLPTPQVTVEVIYTRDTGGSGTGYGALVFKKKGTADTGDRIWNIENDNASAGWGVAWQYWFSTQLGIWSTPYPSAGALNHDIIRHDASSTANNPTWWRNGAALTVTKRLSPSGTARTDGKNIYIGNNSTAYTSGWDGKVYLVRVWNRILSNAEVYDLYKDPNCIYKKQTVLGKAAAAVGTVVKDIIGGFGFIPAPR